MKQIRIAAIAWLVIVLAGCATFQQARTIATPDTPQETIIAAYGLYAFIGFTTADYVRQGIITKQRAIEIQSYLADIRPHLETVRLLVQRNKTVPDAAVEWLNTVHQELLNIRNKLRGEYGQGRSTDTAESVEPRNSSHHRRNERFIGDSGGGGSA